MSNTGGPAFPVPGLHKNGDYDGMTLRQYAAIKLKIPDSGTDWLDAMIVQSNRNDFAAKAMQALITRIPMSGAERARDAYIIADAMLAAREQK